MNSLPAISNRAVIFSSLILGLLIRSWPLLSPPASSTLWDHHEYVRWGRLMLDDGLTAIYDRPPPEISMWNHDKGRAVQARHDEQFICNYPPLGVYLVYLEGWCLQALSPEYVSNTMAARRLYSVLPVLGDLLTAWGLFSLVRRWSGGRLAAWAFAAVFLLPPLMIDSTWWTQTDSWVLAPAVWMLACMTSGQWLVAGLCWGLGLGIKPQSILLAAVWLFAFCFSTRRRSVLLGMSVVFGVFLVSSLPFVLSSGWRWLECSYITNLAHMYPVTTLNAFNVWYLDLLLSENNDAGRRLFGLTKDTWGKMLLLFGTGLAFWRLGRARIVWPAKLVVFTAALLLMAVLLPTRVHERYVVLPLPFMVAAVLLGYRKLAAPLLLFTVAAGFQLTSLQWSPMGPQFWGEIEGRVRSQYEDLRTKLPPGEFAKLSAPEEQLKADRERYLKDRNRLGSQRLEKGVLLLSLVSGFGCLAILLLGRPSERLKEEAKGAGAGHQPDQGASASAA